MDIEVIHGAKFEFWVPKNVLGEKEDTCSIQG
jgi:hypothetical protein